MVVLYPLLIQLKFSYFTFLLGYPNSQLGFQTFPNIGQVASGSAFTYCYISKYFLPYIQYGHNLLVFGKKKRKFPNSSTRLDVLGKNIAQKLFFVLWLSSVQQSGIRIIRGKKCLFI